MTDNLTGSRIALDRALALIEAGREVARDSGLAFSFAVVDPGGALVAAARMDDAPFGATDVALDKAHTAVAFRMPTSAWATSTAPGGADWGLHTALSGRMVVYPGGVPLFDGADLIGGLGISGAAGVEDERTALAALDALDLAPAPPSAR